MQTEDDAVYERLAERMGVPEGKPLDFVEAVKFVLREGKDTEALGSLKRGMVSVLVQVREKKIQTYQDDIAAYREELDALEQAIGDSEITFDDMSARFYGQEWKEALANA